MRLGHVAIGAICGWCVACAPHPVADVDTGAELDATADIGELVDESDGGVTDAVVDTPALDVPKVGPDATVDADVDSSSDIPQWMTLDVDPTNLGVINTPECSNQEMIVQPYALPIPPSATEPCPPPYASTCGTCPWIQTPKLKIPRFGAQALWTGEEFLVIGGSASYTANIGYSFSMERWNPKKDSGFTLIDSTKLPFKQDYPAGDPSWVRAFWTGDQAIVLLKDHSFRFNPKTNVFTLLPPIPTIEGSAVLVDGKIFWWGRNGTKKESALALYDPAADTWTPVPFPEKFLDPKVFTFQNDVDFATKPRNMTVLGDDVYVFAPAIGYVSGSGLDQAKALMLRLNLPTLDWAILPQPEMTMLDALDTMTLMGAFPDGIVAITDGSFVDPQAPSGRIFWHKKVEWTAMKPPPFGQSTNSGLPPPGHIWTGDRFVVEHVHRPAPPFSKATSGTYPAWPLLFDPYKDSWQSTTGVGAPKHGLGATAVVYTGAELFQFGGVGGQFQITLYADGVRFFLPNSITPTEVLP